MSTRTIEPAAQLDSIGPLTDIEIKSGSVSLDGGRVPYAMADVTVSLADIPDLDDVDPRGNIRAVIGATDGTTSRTFDLSVQGRSIDEAAQTVTFSLASDEAKLRQYTRLADDATWASGSSSLLLVNYHAVDTVTGGTFAFFESIDFESVADSTNLIRNPRVGVNITDWNTTGGLLTTRLTSGGPFNSPTYINFQAGGSGSSNPQVFLDQSVISVSPNRRYVLSADVYATGSRQMRIASVIFDSSGNPVAYGPSVSVTPAGNWTRVHVAFDVGSTASKLRPLVEPVGGLAGSEQFRVTAWRLSEFSGDEIEDSLYLDGDIAADPYYTYSWVDGAHVSLSRKQVISDDPSPSALTWRAGDDAWSWLEPLNARYNRRVWCDENRAWRLANPDTWSVAGTVTLDGVRTENATHIVALGDTEQHATGVIVRYRWTGLDGMQYVQLDTAGSEEQVRVVQIDRPYPGPGAAAAILARMAGRGAVETYTALLDYTATPGKTAACTLPGKTTRNLYLASVEWNLTEGLMRVTTKAVI